MTNTFQSKSVSQIFSSGTNPHIDLQGNGTFLEEGQNSESLINDETEVRHTIIKNPASSQKRKQNAKRKLLPCDKYEKGECQNGVLCSYMHQEFPCIFFYLGIKCSDEHCKFLHNEPLPINILKAFIKYVQTIPLEKVIQNSFKINKTSIENTINNIQIKLLRKKYKGIEYETIASAKDSKPLDETLSFLSQQQLKQLKEMGIRNHYEVIMLTTWQLNTLGIKDGVLYQKMIDACLDIKYNNNNDQILQKRSENSNIAFDNSPRVFNNYPIEISLDDHIRLARLPKDVFCRKILERNYYLTNHPLPKVVRIREMEKFCAQLKALQEELLGMMPVQYKSPKMSKTTMVVVHDLSISKEENELENYSQTNKEKTLNKINIAESKHKVINFPATKETLKTFKIRMPFGKYKQRNKCTKNLLKEFDANRSDKTIKNKRCEPDQKTLSFEPEETAVHDLETDYLSRVGRDKFRFALKKCRVMLKRLKEMKTIDVAKTSTPKKPKKLLNFFHNAKKLEMFNNDKNDGSITRFEKINKIDLFDNSRNRNKDDQLEQGENTLFETIQQIPKTSTIIQSNKVESDTFAGFKVNKSKNQNGTKFRLNRENIKNNKTIEKTTSIKRKVNLTILKKNIKKLSKDKNRKEGEDTLYIDNATEDVLKKGCINECHLKVVNETLLSPSSEEKIDENFNQKTNAETSQLEKFFVPFEQHPANSVNIQKEQSIKENCPHVLSKKLKDDTSSMEKYHSDSLPKVIPKEIIHNQSSTKLCNFEVENLESVMKNNDKIVMKDVPQIVSELQNNSNNITKKLHKETVEKEKDNSGSISQNTPEEKIPSKLRLSKGEKINHDTNGRLSKINKKLKKLAQKSKGKDTKTYKKRNIKVVSRNALIFDKVSEKILSSSKPKSNIEKQKNLKENLKIVQKIPESNKLHSHRSEISMLTKISHKTSDHNKKEEFKEAKEVAQQESTSEILKSYYNEQNLERIESEHSSTAYQPVKKMEKPNRNSKTLETAKTETITGKPFKQIPLTSKEDQHNWNGNSNFFPTKSTNNPIKTEAKKICENSEKINSNGINMAQKRSSSTMNELCGRPYKIPKMTILIGPHRIVASEKFQSSDLNQATISSLLRNPFKSVERKDCNELKAKSSLLDALDPSLKSNPVSKVQDGLKKNKSPNDQLTTMSSYPEIHWENVHHSTPIQTFEKFNQNNATKEKQILKKNNNEDDFIELSYSDISSIQSTDDNYIKRVYKAKPKCFNRQHSSRLSSGSNIEFSQELLQDWDQEFMSMNYNSTLTHNDKVKTGILSKRESLSHVSKFSSTLKVYPHVEKKAGEFYSTNSHKDECINYLPWVLRKIDLSYLEVNKPDRLEELLSKKAYGDPRLLKYEYMAIKPIKTSLHQNPNEQNRILLLNTLRNSEWYKDLQSNDKHQVTKLLLFTLMRLLIAYHEKCHQTTKGFDFKLATTKNANEIKSFLEKIHLDINERGEIISLDTIPKKSNTYNGNQGCKRLQIRYPRPLNAPVGSYFWPDRHSIANAEHQLTRKNKYYYSQWRRGEKGRKRSQKWY